MRQALEASERKITNLNRTFHASCKIKGEPSCGDSIALVNEHLMKRACCRFICLYMQVTSSLLGTLLDVLEEVQLAQLELPNLNQSSFYCPSVEQLQLQICFIKFISRRKVTLTCLV